jgi:hypothetical protein
VTVRRRLLTLVVVVVAIAIGLNVTGVVPVPGGPVGVASQPPGGQFGLAIMPAGRTDPNGTVYTTLYLTSSAPVAATLISVTPMDVTAGAQVSVFGTAAYDESSNLALGSAWDPGPGWQNPDPAAGATIPTGGPGHYLLVLVGIRATTPDDAAVGWFRIDYSVGPFRFQSVDETSILLCAVAGTPSAYPEPCATS